MDQLLFPFHLPVAMVYLNDKGMRFDGKFPSVDDQIYAFRVWNDADNIGTKRLLLIGENDEK